MGSMQAGEMRRFLAEDQALRWHLTSNHYPPISEAFLPAVKQALQLAREAGFDPMTGQSEDPDKWDEEIELPNGNVLTVSQIVEEIHLHTFLEEDPDG